ncbi:MAG: L-fuculose-phosphate aldolase [Deltaproteobacteria bacterium]|nr:L-fuculose-phosphate aldolase [Deltaproteobacteria bacterium]
MLLEQERQLIVAYGKKLIMSGLTRGTGGNLSICDRESGFTAISPSGLDYFETNPEDVPVVDHSGLVVDGRRKPSSELPFHLVFYQSREDISSVVHTHSVYATTLACLGLELPAVHYLIGFAGSSVRCAPYATYGTDALARSAFDYMEGRKAVLLANHGLIAGGATIQQAFQIAEAVEFCAEIYCRCRAMGQPLVLSSAEMAVVMDKFTTYGKQ